MNPFDLRGPDFLFFYLVLVIVTCLALYWLRRSSESGPLPSMELNDPYLFAFLKGGAKEALQASTISLIDRGLLKTEKGLISSTPAALVQSPVPPIEREVLHYFSTPDSFRNLLPDVPGGDACRSYEEKLRSYKLLPDTAIKSERYRRLAVAIVVLASVAIMKIIVALSRGRKNVDFLVILSIIGKRPANPSLQGGESMLKLGDE